jgi:membrane protein DedA with SNARE-associated domain
MANLIEWGTGIILGIIAALSYPGIVFLMALESACMPVPSEIVMPFGGALASGYLVHLYPKLDFWLVGMAGTIGCLIGSLAAYYVGYKVGRPAVEKYGKYFLISKKHLKKTDKFFKKRGEMTVFVSRLLPVVRTFISLPAGIARMDIKKFTIYTFLGCLPWCYGLTYVGYWLGPRWRSIMSVFHKFDIVVIIALIIFIIWYIWYLRKE